MRSIVIKGVMFADIKNCINYLAFLVWHTPVSIVRTWKVTVLTLAGIDRKTHDNDFCYYKWIWQTWRTKNDLYCNSV